MGVKIELEEVKNRLKNIFGDKYEYDFLNFKNTHSKIDVKCPIEYCKKNYIKLIIIKQDKKHINNLDVESQIQNIKNLL